MARRFALPFKTALATDLDLGAWHFEQQPGVPIRIGKSIPGWDYLKEVKLLREVAVQFDHVLVNCALDEGNEITLVVTVHSPPARYRAVCYQSVALSSVRKTELVLCNLESSKLAGELLIDTELILTKASGVRKPFLAHLLGSRLFSETVSVELEGSSSRLPLEVAKFSEDLAWLQAPRAPWYVDCGTGDMHAPIMRDLRVFLNSEELTFADAARRADPALVSVLGAETTRQILHMALNDEEFLAGSRDYAEGTLGEAAGRLLSLCFGIKSAKDVKALAALDRAKFDAAILSSMNVTQNA